MNILIVEDDADGRANLRDILELDGHEVDAAGTAGEALGRDDLGRFDAILLDRRLPDATADTILPEVRRRAPEAAVIVITGYADLAGAVAALRDGASDYLLKPVHPDVLRACIDRAAGCKRAEARLRESEARLRAIIDTAADAIIVIDEHGDVESFNRGAERMFDYDADEVIGRNVALLMPPPDCLGHDGYMAHYAENGRPRIIGIGREVAGRRKDGSTFPLQLAISELELPGRRLFTGILRDVTELREFERRLVQSERLAAIGQVVASVAHETRNALNRIGLAVGLLRIKLAARPGELRDVHAIREAADDIRRLLDEVRGYAAPITLRREPASMADLWRRAWSELEPARAGREAALCERFGADDAHCEVDAPRLVQVFRNLFENALAATPDPVRIEVRAEAAEVDGRDALRLTVRDNGPGLSPEQRQKVFDAFFTTKPEGTGLGMAIVRRIVEAHGGTIAAGDGGGPGAEFVLTLPRR